MRAFVVNANSLFINILINLIFKAIVLAEKIFW